VQTGETSDSTNLMTSSGLNLKL